MTKFYIESASTMIRTASLVGMIVPNSMTIKLLSAFGMIAVNLAKVIYEYKKAKCT
jgi:hypothetical protein